MIFIVRGSALESPGGVRVVLSRRTPAPVAVADGQRDLFCVGDAGASERLRQSGWNVVEVHDGWYADDATGGVAVWGHGRFWEVRDTPFSMRECDVDKAPE